jgi:hypothetical protein
MSPAGTVFAQRVGMAVLEFTDVAGGRWLVWATIPSPGSVLGPLGSGWLTFDGPTSRRRLSPIPEGWETASQRQLEQLWERAVTIRRTPAGGMQAEAEDR